MRALSTRRAGWTASVPPRQDFDGFVAILAAALGGGAAAAALGCAAVLVTRRLAVPAAVPAAVAVPIVATAAAALVALADIAFRLGGPWPATVATRAGAIVGLAAVALPLRVSTWIDAAATALALAIAAAAVCFTPRSAEDVAPAAAAAPRRRPVRRSRAAPPAGRLRQRFTRYESPAGDDCLRGRIVIGVAPGARTALGHVGFCPAFAATPAVDVTTDYDGVEAVVSAAEVLPWGVRVEARLAEPAEEPLEIPVDLVVHGAG